MFGRGLKFTAGYALIPVVGVLATPFTTRLLGQSAYGTVALVNTIGSLLMVVVALGMQVGIQSHFATEGGSGAEARSILAVSLLCVLVVSALVDMSAPLWLRSVGFTSDGWLVQCDMLWPAMAAGCSLILALIRMQDRLKDFVLIVVLQTVVGQLFAFFSVLTISRSALGYFAGLTAGQGLAFGVGLLMVRPWQGSKVQGAAVRRALLLSLPFLPHTIALQVLNLGDRVVVQRDLGATSVARYQVAYNAAGVAVLGLAMLNTAWDAQVFGLVRGAHRADVLTTVRDEVYRLLVPVLLAAALFAPVGLRIFAPPSYQTDGLLTLFAIVACSVIPFAAYQSNLRVLLADRKTGAMVWASPVAALLNILLNLLLVPVFGLNGSAAATVIGFGFLALFTGLVARRVESLRPVPKRSVVALVASVLAAVGLAHAPTDSVGLSIRVLLAGACCAWFVTLIRHVTVRSHPESIEPQQKEPAAHGSTVASLGERRRRGTASASEQRYGRRH